MDFFENAVTFWNNTSNVTCCHPDKTSTNVTCGQGFSCEGQCSALGASLCPSGNCTDDPRTCDLEFNDNSTVVQGSGGSTPTFLSSTDLKWCISDGCRVRVHPVCCYNPTCLTWIGRKEACSWLNYLTGMERPKKTSPQAKPHLSSLL